MHRKDCENGRDVFAVFCIFLWEKETKDQKRLDEQGIL